MLAASLGLFAGNAADNCRVGQDVFAYLSAPRARPRKGWRVPVSPSGWPVLLDGWIDNHLELASELGLNPAIDSPQLYGAAVERWGNSADRHVIGDYAAIVCLPDDTVRLSRAPWSSHGLFWSADGTCTAVASIPRPLFAMGVPKKLRPEAIDALLTMQGWFDDRSEFENIHKLADGRIVILGRGPDPVQSTDWYNPCPAPVRLRDDRAYVEEAWRLLVEAADKAVIGAKNPCIALSGGLDSSLVCAATLQALPPERRLKSITFGPVGQFGGLTDPAFYADDRPYVAAFAAMHPRLDPLFIDNAQLPFDDRAQQLFLASDSGTPSRLVSAVHHGVLDRARQEGADLLLTAWRGNDTFSASPPWAMPEFLRTGQLGRLWRLAAARQGDPRPVWRRALAHGLMPNLPLPLRERVRSMLHGGPSARRSNPFLSAAGRLAEQRHDAACHDSLIGQTDLASADEFHRYSWRWMGSTPELAAGMQQVFGLRSRDVTNYRPLVEFCFGLPTTQFINGGESRWLARRMAKGRLPEAQRTNRLYGDQNVDWHERLTPQVPAIRRDLARLADHPEMAGLVDIDKALAALDAWPDEPTLDSAVVDACRFFLPGLGYVGRYLDYVSGWNAE